MIHNIKKLRNISEKTIKVTELSGKVHRVPPQGELYNVCLPNNCMNEIRQNVAINYDLTEVKN